MGKHCKHQPAIVEECYDQKLPEYFKWETDNYYFE